MNTKKILCVLLSVCMVIALAACSGKDPKESKKADEEISCALIEVMVGDEFLEEWNENDVLTRVMWQRLRLPEEYSVSYPALAAAFDQYNSESKTDAEVLMDEFATVSQDMVGGEYYDAMCEAEANVYMQRADDHLVSMLESVYQYTGGVHPDYFVNGVNFNTQTGEKAALTDVLTETKDLPDILSKKVTEKYSDVAFGDLNEIFTQYNAEDFTWTMDYQGITFWFSPYEIAAYAVGTLSAKIWFDEYPDMFNKEYTAAPERYVISVPLGYEFEFDLKGDGVKDLIYAEEMPDEYGSYNILSLTVNGKTGTDETSYAYNHDVYLAHVGGKNYIYSDSVSDNDYHIFCTWDINGNIPRVTDTLDGTEIDYEYIEEGFEYGTVYKRAFNNPDAFRLEKRFNILGTRGGTATFKVGEGDGKPQLTEGVYTFNPGGEVKTIISLEAELLPDMEKTQIPAGTVLYPYQTDGVSFADLKTEDDRILRFDIDVSDWPRLVNGMEEDECFEGLMYAG